MCVWCCLLIEKFEILEALTDAVPKMIPQTYNSIACMHMGTNVQTIFQFQILL